MPDGSSPTSILDAARQAGSTILDIAETRLALLSIDLQAAAHRYARLVICGVIGVFCFALGIMLLVFAVITLFWETHRLASLLVSAGVLLGTSGIISLAVMRNVRRHRNLFATTIEELAKDREQLSASQ